MVPAFGSGGAQLPRQMRHEIFDADDRSLLWSYLLAVSLGSAWILLVALGPAAPRLIEPPTIDVPTALQWKGAVSDAPALMSERAGASRGNSARSVLANVADAFAGNPSGIAVDVANTLRGLQTSSGTPAIDRSAKVALEAGTSGLGQRTPGHVSLGAALPGTALGAVGGPTIGIKPTAVIGPPVVRPATPRAPARDAATLGDVVRANQAALNSCYVTRGLAQNASLAGTVRLTVAIAADGRVSQASVAERSWSGAGVADVESCLIQAVSGWRFGSGAGAMSTTFVVSFTR